KIIAAPKSQLGSSGSRRTAAGTAATARGPWFADLHTAMEFGLSNIHYRDYVIDSAEGSLNGSDDILGLDRLNLRRNQNELNVRGRYWLPREVGKFSSQPAELDFGLNAPEAGDFWVSDSPNRLSGPLQMAAQITWKQEAANGQVSISGSNLKMRDLVFRQLNTQGSISNSVVYLNDFSAILNDTDFFNATGTLNLRRPYRYDGKISARVANLSTLQPLLSASGNQNQLAGSFPLVWKNLGTNAAAVPSSGKVFATIQSENLDLKKLFSDLGIKPMTSGTLNARLDAQGTIGDLNARLNLQMRDLRSEQLPKMEPATFDLSAEAVHDRLTILGKLQQARIQPLELNANIPFDIPKIARAGRLPDETPITAKARLPRSSVNFVRQFVPELE